MGVLTERNYLSDWLREERENGFSREAVTIYTSTGVLPSGQVLGTDGSNVSAYDNDTAYVTAVGILIEPVDASVAPVKGAMIARDAGVVLGGLTFGSANDTGDIAAGVSDLESLGIVFREGN
jgi:hypothetical protein